MVHVGITDWFSTIIVAILASGVGGLIGFSLARLKREQRKAEVIEILEGAKQLIHIDRNATSDSIGELLLLLREADKHAGAAEVAGKAASVAAEKAAEKAQSIKDDLEWLVINDDITPAQVDDAIEAVKKMPDIEPLR